MSEYFVTVDLSEWDNLIRKLAPQKQVLFINRYINRMLFSAREYMISTGMAKSFIIRNKGLLKKHLGYTKAVGMVGYFGSIAGNESRASRFTGWKEQQLGTKQERKINIINSARGSKSSVLNKKFRRNKDFPNMLQGWKSGSLSKLKHNTTYNRFIATWSIMKREGFYGSVYIPEKIKGRPAGVYMMLKSGSLKLKTSNKTVEPKQNHWATVGLNSFLRFWNIKGIAVAKEEFERILK